MSVRYFIGCDNSSHRYVVPVAMRAEWEEWANLPEEDERSWEAPGWANRVPGSLALLTFAEPEVE